MNSTKHSPKPTTKKPSAGVLEMRRLEKEKQKSLFNWNSTAVTIIKDKLAARKAIGWNNDWKVKFYEDKLSQKNKLLGKLKKLIK